MKIILHNYGITSDFFIHYSLALYPADWNKLLEIFNIICNLLLIKVLYNSKNNNN